MAALPSEQQCPGNSLEHPVIPAMARAKQLEESRSVSLRPLTTRHKPAARRAQSHRRTQSECLPTLVHQPLALHQHKPFAMLQRNHDGSSISKTSSASSRAPTTIITTTTSSSSAASVSPRDVNDPYLQYVLRAHLHSACTFDQERAHQLWRVQVLPFLQLHRDRVSATPLPHLRQLLDELLGNEPGYWTAADDAKLWNDRRQEVENRHTPRRCSDRDLFFWRYMKDAGVPRYPVATQVAGDLDLWETIRCRKRRQLPTQDSNADRTQAMLTTSNSDLTLVDA